MWCSSSAFCLDLSNDRFVDAGRDGKQRRKQQRSSRGGEGGYWFLHGLLSDLLWGSIGDTLAVEDSFREG